MYLRSWNFFACEVDYFHHPPWFLQIHSLTLSFVCFGSIWSEHCSHDDVIKCNLFPRYWPFVKGIHRSPVDSPHKDQWRGALMLFLICPWTNGWANYRDAVDLRRHRAHYDLTVMRTSTIRCICWPSNRNILVISHEPFRAKFIFMKHTNIYIYPIIYLPAVTLLKQLNFFLVDVAIMMTSSNGNILRVTGPLYGEFIGHRWNPLTKASDAERWYFLWSAPEQTVG